MKRSLLLLLVMAALLVACQKSTDNAEEATDILKLETVETGICFNFVYPIIVEFRDGSTTRVQDQTQLRRILASCGGQQCFGYVYPLTVVFRGGNTAVVENDQQMRRVYASCD